MPVRELNVVLRIGVICPWCCTGKRRLERAVAASEGHHEVRGSPFNPTMPKGDISRKEHRTAEFGSWDRSLELDARVVEVGEMEGIPFAFDWIERTPYTLDAHRLVWLADKDGVQDAVVEALFRSYFTRGPGHRHPRGSFRRTRLGHGHSGEHRNRCREEHRKSSSAAEKGFDIRLARKEKRQETGLPIA
jgi:hypothetical protein